MHIDPLKLPGAALVRLEKREDERGFFARAFCEREFAAAGLESRFVQGNLSQAAQRGTLRGLHYQLPPAAEVKLVRCLRGALWDVIVDLRPGSPTYLQHCGVELSGDNRLALYVPAGFAHSFLTLSDDSEAFYLVSSPYQPELERGLRYSDPALGIDWPEPVRVCSDKDAHWPLLDPAYHCLDLLRSLPLPAPVPTPP